MFKDCGTVTKKGYMCHINNRKEKERKGTEEIFEVLKAENFPKIKDRHQSTDPGSSQHKCKQINTPKIDM